MVHAQVPQATRVVLCVPLRRGLNGSQILLGLKKRGFGTGKLVAPGGKIEPLESPEQAAVRELFEETALLADPMNLQPAARVYFRFPGAPAADMDATIYLSESFTGRATETAELQPGWFPVGHLPLTRMWEDSGLWLSRLLNGERFDAWVRLGADNQSVAGFATIPWLGATIPAEPATEADFLDIT